MTSHHATLSRLSAGVFARVVSLALAGLVVVAGQSAAAAQTLTDPEPRSDYLVSFASGVAPDASASTLASAEAVVSTAIPALRLYGVSLTDAGAQALRADESVTRVEADLVREVQGVPDDPAYGDQWALPQIGWDAAYGSITPSGSATVAVLDTGVNPTDDLAGQLVPGASMLAGVEGTNDPNGHGTAMASIVAAGVDNGTGIAGVGYRGVSVMPVKVLDSDGLGQDSAIVEGVVYAADHGADVILMAFSNPGRSEALQAAADYAWSKGAVLVAASGNDGSTANTFPAGLAKVVGVSATTRDDTLWSGSSSGDGTFLAAPGVDISSGSGSLTGTSASAAIAAGAAALVKANDPSASNGVVVGRLARNADPAGTVSDSGNGRVNLARALEDSSTEAVVPAGVAGDGGPIVGPYVAAALGVTATYSSTTSTITTTITGAAANKRYDITYTPPSASGQPPRVFSCVEPGGSGGNITFSHSYALPSGFASGTWTITVDEYNSGQGCAGTSNRTASVSTTAVVLAPATISGVVFNDANNNGTLDSGEALSGAVLSLFKDSNANGAFDVGSDTAVSTQNSTGTGTWSFGSLGLSTTYFVLRTNPTGYTSSNAVPGTDSNTTTTKVTNDQLKVIVSGNSGASSTSNKFVARITSRAPVAVDDAASTTEDTAAAFNVIGNDTDADGDALTVNAGSISAPAHGTAMLVTSGADAGKILYTPNANYVGPDSFTYRATDGGLDSNVATVSVTVSGVNDAPVAVDDAAETAEDTSVAKNVIANDTDVDNTTAQLSVKPGSLSATNGTATLDADGVTIHFTPDADLNNGNVDGDGFTVTYRATDGTADSNVATLRISVTGVNDAPVAVDDAAETAEDTSVAKNVIANDTDVDNTTAQLSVKPGSLSATNGTATLDADGVTIHFTPDADLNNGNVDGDGFTVTYRATDGTADSNVATLRISVTGVNDAPV
ncbi:tandem-95 repeat protein, partial [Nocardioides sp. HM23]|uniref:Ig-like domain-containing protein n=1 Tax=Nocardioides bizhenqiangii TaxID=3095076 RepID=UPI002ACA304A